MYKYVEMIWFEKEDICKEEELKMLNGSPISLLKLASVDDELSSVEAMILVVVVLPLLPVIATTFPS